MSASSSPRRSEETDMFSVGEIEEFEELVLEGRLYVTEEIGVGCTNSSLVVHAEGVDNGDFASNTMFGRTMLAACRTDCG